MLHGVGGSSESHYLVRAGKALYRAGYNAIRLNFRGAGEGVEHATSIYHAGLTSDPHAVVEALSADRRVASLYVLAFSLGGSLALKLAGEWGDAAPSAVRALATISAPTDFMPVSDELERLRTLPYRRFILRAVIRQALIFKQRHPERAHFDSERLVRARTIRAYDAEVMVPMHGFASVRDYYESTTAAPWLRRVRVPVLLLHAEDDPIIPASTVAPTLRGLPRCFRVAWTRRGGHVGWISGASERAWVDTWAVQRALAFFERPEAMQ